ncbi:MULTISPECIES: cation diffusion facilitator family transporter [unclassified Neptuniibacter]|uniref:cation diffusion facilitator family transporter n=1 Tax=unclassified Neptuniibacter TaxID=2630693 RepID=UPI000C501619|nr:MULTISPECIES: cation diffusion facilitator family transporter [unclassified Neptuniibacter]MAY41332.1 cation-efflux pump [Oceanospirillaceae bacterium]|tara:strand:+ start:31269 stop:32438 length:1170 start_codon:yes stop_codon:yes gene_type:complete
MQRDHTQIKAANKVTLIGAFLDLALGFLKITFGTLSNSSALIADGIHSLSDLLTDILVLGILKISAKGPDEDHPWGHGHFETVGTAILGSILIAVAGAMAYDSTLHLLNNEELPIPSWPALVVALVSIAAKEWIYHYTVKVGRALSSDLLIANAWHSRTDAISSVIVFIGIAGAMSGLNWLDAVAAIFVAIMVAKIGWDLSWNSFQELVGTALPAEKVRQYEAQVLSIEGIVNVHNFKTRTIGSKTILEMHIQVSPYISASEGHLIGDTACQKLFKNDDIAHIIFHIDTYDDEDTEITPHKTLQPMRSSIESIIRDYLGSLNGEISLYRIHLHYLDDKIDIEILLNKNFTSRLDIATDVLIHNIKVELEKTAIPEGTLGKVFFAVGIEQ